jgi:hypothetical protein
MIESDNFHKTLMKYEKSYIIIPKKKLYTNRYFIWFDFILFLYLNFPPKKENYLNLH